MTDDDVDDLDGRFNPEKAAGSITGQKAGGRGGGPLVIQANTESPPLDARPVA